MPRETSQLVEVVRRRIRELRVEHQLTQAELCERAGLSTDSITRLETGKREPTLRTIEALAAALRVSPSQFFAGAPIPAERESSRAMRRVVAMLEGQPDRVLSLAEDVVTILVRPGTDAKMASKKRPAPTLRKKKTAHARRRF